MKADLTNAELDELDALLQQAPDPLDPLDVVSLDGYLCAVAVQPRIVPPADWLARALDTDGSRWPPAQVDEDWLSRVRALLQRRYEALIRGLSEEGVFDPVVSDLSDPIAGETGPEVAPGAEPGAEARTTAEPEPDSESEADPLDQVPPHSRPLVHWASGFLYGAQVFDGLLDHADDSVHLALSRILRHLPPEDDNDRRMVAELDAQHPLKNDTHAIEDVVDAAVMLWHLTQAERSAVKRVQREGTKIGRNDPCACGSGKKFKHCHGRT